MPQLEPTYLRYIYNGLIKGSIHPENAAELPDGLIGMYEEAFDERTSVVDRQKLLQRFAIWALLKKEVSAAFVAEILGETEDDIQEFISTYSAWFNSPESGKYQLYHERLKVYLLQKLSENTFMELLSILSKRLTAKEQTKELKIYANEWRGFHSLLYGDLKNGRKFLKKNLNKQKENWWESTFELYCTCIFIDSDYAISETEINFYAQIKSRQFCTTAAKLVVRNFESIAWDEFEYFSRETRFHYVFAGILNERFDDVPKKLVHQMILDETHYLSYVMAYAWKYHCWTNKNVLYPAIIEEIKKKGSPYLRILLHQIDGGRRMLNLSPILNNMDYEADCWEYVSDDFLDFIKSGKEQYLERFLNNSEFQSSLKNSNIAFILEEFSSLHIQIERIQGLESTIKKSPYFFQIIEILWLHPAWEIGDIGIDLVRQKLISLKNKSALEDYTKWIFKLAKEQNLYFISILIFDLMDVTDISDQYAYEIINLILDLNDAQMRGQFVASANDFFSNNNDSRWLNLFKNILPYLCKKATDIWETQELIYLFETLNERLSRDEIEYYCQLHNLIKKIPNALSLDWDSFWRKAEKMRIRGEI